MRRWMKIGELARMTGVTVRTLQYYDRIGLLPPAHVTEAGHRLYDERSVGQLYAIAALKQLGLSLAQIKELKATAKVDLGTLIDMQLARLREEIAKRQALMARLTEVRRRLQQDGRLSIDEFQSMLHFLEGLAGSAVTQEVFAQLQQVRDRLHQQEELLAKWPGFIEQLRRCCQQQLGPEAPEVQECVAYWRDFVARTIGGHPDLREVAFAFHRSGRGRRLSFGLTEELYRYLKAQDQAMSHRTKPSLGPLDRGQ